MNINIIVACDKNNLIGKNGTLPWKIKEDWDYFLEKINDGVLIMGRKCYLDFQEQAKSRTVIALSRNPDVNFKYADKAGSLSEALKMAKSYQKEIWICGGCSIYEEAFPIADRLYLTEIDAEYEGDVFLPEWKSFFQNEITHKTINTRSNKLTFRVLTK